MDRTRNPEFTAMEIYVAYKMMEFTENLVEHCAIAVNGTTDAAFGDHSINFKTPYIHFCFKIIQIKNRYFLFR